MGWSGAGISLINLPSVGFQIRTTLSAPAVASLVPSWLKSKAATGPLVSNRRGAATGSCQSLASPSEPAETSCWLLGR